MTVDRALFLERVQRKPFKGALTQGQRQGLNFILDEWDRRRGPDPRWLAYMLATAFHETARTMQPGVGRRPPGSPRP